ncbi:MAG TPA: DUF262 domain-containing protein [Flavobacteriales bacterium]|nr:MAG: DUF262 domain-containing protein [Flavobacteriales bacterium]HQV38935.1 DUF262 domain-containing protein [Flavobacteriales bacterium]HQW32419.1 DUF262 domain-containing protein [Flavobacteriales bacterium]HQY79917.1 DUF262 domain-containing protein [Flavobacteriales bacterium]HRA17655.1 DUF262 domain-containing protein [Flavobacteriales bacterium]
MREILGKAKTVRELLKEVKYSIDYYQREYKWHEKQIRELVDDLSDKFLEEYQPGHPRAKVAEYPHYFLGSIIISKKENVGYIVDGQQRLTSLTLLLILLRNLQKGREKQVKVDELIFSEKFDQKSYNLHVDERTPAMDALYEGLPFDVTDRPESVQNLVQRYRDLESCFPEELRDDALPYFIDWLLENVHLVEITAYSDDDAYTIFETMNDRGLSLSPTDMLKGYLLANIDENKRTAANTKWRDRIRVLNEAGKEVESDFFKTWLRSQYATKIRERKKNARPEDFDRIGTEFHRWLRDTSDVVGLKQSADFYRFIDRDFEFYSRQYLRLIDAGKRPVPGLEHVLYNAQHGFTLQYMLLMSPLDPDDSDEVVVRKAGLVARYLDILLTWRLWNFRTISYSGMQYAMFLVMRDIRGLAVDALSQKLHDLLTKESENFTSNDRLRVHQQNRYYIHRLLARITDFVETSSGQPSRYLDYVSEGKTRCEVEHIWADHAERHTDEFDHPADFAEYRNRIGGLLLLPKSFNASYGDLTYIEKLPHYNTQNLLARSLHPQCYQHNPGFIRFKSESEIPFAPMPAFKKTELEARGDLYRQLAEKIWDPAHLLQGVPA